MKRLVSDLLLSFGALAMQAHAATVGTYGRGFPTATSAAQALVDAAKSDNTAELAAILGPSSKDIVVTPDAQADRRIRREFVAKASQKMRVVPVPGRPAEMTLVAGNDNWPLPIPIVKVGGQWYFDMARGRRAILTRRIGSNEVDAIEVCRGYVEAQNQFAELHHTAAGVPYYAQKILSSPGERNGLYWDGEGQDQSPIGKIIARAISEGYKQGEPYHGYYFRVLTSEGRPDSNTPVSYIDKDYMTKGFALIAWPARYGVSGVMTFIVNKSGVVYQKNLGPGTSSIASKYPAYRPDTWAPVSTRVAASRDFK